jgi:CrcB protein
MLNYLLVFVGGGLGSICRYGIAHLLQPYKFQFPYGTLIANAVSCVLLGVLVGLSLKGQVSRNYQFLLMTGFCGGFSTFSTFSNETFLLFENGHLTAAFLNVAGSLFVGLACIYLGLKLVH